MTLAPLLRLRMQKYSNKLLSQTRQLKALLGTTVTAPDKSPVLITEDLLRAEHLKQRAYFGAPPVRADTPNVAVLELVLKEQALKHKANVAEANRKTMIDSGVPAEVADARFRDELSRIPIDRLYATTAELKRKLDELGQDRAEWDEGSERYVLAMRKRVPEWKIYRTLINAELAEAKLAEALKNPELKNEHLFVLQRDVANLKEDAQRQMNLLGQDSEAWKRKRLDKDGKDIGPGEHWARQHHLNAVSKVSVICQRLYKSAASRSLEFFQLKAQVTGQKERDRVMRDMLSRYPAMESDIKAFNSEIKELPAKYRPSELTMAAFAEPDAEETCGVDGKPKPNPRDALFYLELCKSTLLGSAAKGRDELWAFSSDVRVGINVQQRRDRCQEELELLKVEWIRLVHYTRTILVTMWEFVSYPTKTEEPFVRIVQSRLWEELQGARNILLTASKSASPLPTGDLAGVAEAIEHHLDVFYREGAPLNNLTRRAPQKSRRKALSDDECPNFLFRDGFIALPTETDTRRPKINTPDANVDLRQFASLLDDVCDFDDVQDDGEDEIKGEGECDEDEQVSPSGVESAFIGLGAELVYNNAESLLGTKEPSEAFLDALPAIVEEAVMEDPTLSSL